MTPNSPEFANKYQETDSFKHDLRTHLSAIVSLTDLIKNTPDPQDCAPLLDALHLAAYHAMNIVEGGTDLRPSRGQYPEQLVGFLADFDQLARGLAKAHDTLFVLHIPKRVRDQALVAPAPVYLHRILMLLLDNALKYADGAPIHLAVTHSQEDTLTLVFSDTGPGFEGQDPVLLFEPYHRGTMPSTIAGSGLGLWSVRHIVSMMGGSVEARENTPSGAQFTICLPLNTDRTAATQTSSDTIPAKSEQPHILIVDDNQTNHLIIGEMLKAMEFRSTHAVSGQEALTLLEQTKPDLAIIDIRMAEMDGWELAKRIWSKNSGHTFPMIALSSDAKPSDIAPFKDWIQRPLDPSILLQMLDRVSGKSL